MTGARMLPGWRCARGHAYLHAHETCPACGGVLARTRLGMAARLVACTTVRVTPDGIPFRLGVAVTREGARTLCVVEGGVRGTGYDRVLLMRDGDRYIALGRGGRLTRNRVPRASSGGC